MRCKTILVALLLLAFGAEAARVSQSEAAGAASVWAGAGKALGVRLGANVKSVREHSVTNGYSFYSVKLDGGTVIMTSDTALAPVVAFSSNGNLDLSEGSPLLYLLRKDVMARVALAGASAGASAATTLRTSSTSTSTAAAASAGASGKNSSLWKALISASQRPAASSSSANGVSAVSSAQPVSSVSDVRVAPLVQSKWSQRTDDDKETGMPCYNCYTPNNYVCGCSATAMSQIMRYFEFPKTEVEALTYDCKVDGSAQKLTMQGGIYDWANMTLVPKDGITEEGCEAIGRLTSDVGIALKSEYSGRVTSAVIEDGAAAFRNAFGYPDAICYWNDYTWNVGVAGLHERKLRTQVILANLDARQPVQLAIYGYPSAFIGNSDYWSGHAVVADGYGYQTVDGVETEYVHINMGWSGLDDMWYNIPEINAANSGAHIGEIGYDYLYIGGAVFNISTNATSAGLSILSGRVVDEDGAAMAGARIRAFAADGAQVGEVKSDANGIYCFKLPGDAAYTLSAVSADGRFVAECDVANLPATKGMNESYVVYDVPNVGNSWGNDMTLVHPTVRVGTAVFSSIDKAVAKARAIAVPGTPVAVEIIADTVINATVTVDFDCILSATNQSPAASSVARAPGSRISVAAGATLMVSNVVFEAADSTVVEVAEGGRLDLVGTVDFAVPYDVAAVRTADADGFCLRGGVEPGFTLDCAAATKAGEVFGYGVAQTAAQLEAIQASAVRVANYGDPVGEQRGTVQDKTGVPPRYPLTWLKQAVPFEDCTGYFIDAAGATNTAARIDRLFDMYSEALERGDLGGERRIVVRRDGTLTRPLAVADGLTLVGEGVTIDLGGASAAGFTVTGGELSVSGISFSNYVGNALFLVDGNGASLALGEGVALSAIEGTNKWSGAVTVLNGSASATGATFENCRATGKYAPAQNRNSCGGAFYLATGTSLALANVSIADCYAKNFGGAVYVETNATVSLSGALYVISGNTSSSGRKDDIYLKNSDKGHAELVLDGAVNGAVGLRWGGKANGFGPYAGDLAAQAASTVVAHASAAAFFSDVYYPNVVAEPDDGATALRWTDAPTGPQPWEGDPDDASARVEYAGVTEYYLLATEGIEAAPDGATVYITGWNGTELTSDLVVSSDITLASDVELGLFWLYRAGDCSIVVGEGASLTLRDISVFGLPVDDGGALVTNSYGNLDYGYYGDYMATRPLFDVRGGSLTLATPSDNQYVTEIAGVLSYDTRAGGAVSVWEGGEFFMESGSSIHDCENWYFNSSDGTGRGGAVLVDDGEAVFLGGTIEKCRARSGGGVFVGNNGTVSVSGDVRIVGNSDLFGEDSNLLVHDLGRLVLAGKMTGAIGYTEGVAGDKVVFGRVADGVSSADAQSSAHKFTNDVTGDVGMAVTGQGGRLLVWSDGLDSNGVYVDDDGVSHSLVAGEAYAIAVPAAVAGLVYTGDEQAGVEEGAGYTLSGSTAVNAGGYVATATPKAGFKWTDGTREVKTVEWSIAKATYDMSEVSFKSKTVVYGGQNHSLEITGELPEGVTVSYANNGQREVGVYTVTASFSGDAANYEAIADMTATLTILAQAEPTPPSPEPPPTPPAQPLPVEFTAISEADGTWTLSVTTTVEKCWYSLYATNSLSGGFEIDGVAPAELRQAAAADVPEMIFTRPSDGSALFWKVVAEPEDAH